jgi:ABC-type Fe3+ transport system substrate-binding protein
LVILSPHREEIRQEVSQGFQEWLRRQPGWEQVPVRIEWRDIGGGSAQMLRYLEALYRTSPDGVGIDLLFGGGTDPYLTLKDNGRLEPWRMPEDLRAKIPQQFSGVDLYDPEEYWHGVMLSSLVIFVNRETRDRLGLHDWLPRSWKDLGDPRLRGYLSAGDPRMSGSVRLLYDLILQVYGWEEGFRVLLRLGANSRGITRFSDSVTKDVVFGRAVAAGSLDSYALSAMAREAMRGGQTSLEAVFPRGETLLNPDSIGILKGAPNRRLAELFVEYNLREEGGQRLWMLQPNTLPGSPKRYAICRLSVMPALYDPQTYPPEIRSVTINPFDASQVGRLVNFSNRLADSRRYVMSDLFGCWIVDTHDELTAAWKAVLRSRMPGTAGADPLEVELFAPPCSEAEAQARNAILRPGRPAERARQLTAWIEEARARYRRVRQQAELRSADRSARHEDLSHDGHPVR